MKAIEVGLPRGTQPILHWIVLVAQSTALAAGITAFGLYHMFGSGGMPKPLAIAYFSLLVILGCWRRGGTAPWLGMMLGVTLFLDVRALADDVGMPLHTEDLQAVERALFFGVVPSEMLQRIFYTPGEFHFLEYAAIGIHWSYFFVPYLVLFIVWLRQPCNSSTLTCFIALTFVSGLIAYVLLPSTPPWLASSHQGMAQVQRILHYFWSNASPDNYYRIYENIGDPNPVAAFPSMHFAITFCLFVYSLGKARIWVVSSLLYSLAMAWALVYLGEHYVVDLLAGAVIAFTPWLAVRALRYRRRTLRPRSVLS